MSNINQKVQNVEAEAIELRRYLHENPELSSQEFETAKLLKEKAVELGLEVRETESTSFIAILDTGKPGKTLGIRTDIDALPIQEDPHNLNNPKGCVSQVEGVMHACGHDGHMSMLMSSMKILSEMKEELSGKIIFIFEEAEETNDGIHIVYDFLKDDYHFDAIYGNHVYNALETGKIIVNAGPVMAAQRGFKMYIRGKGGHGSRPDLAISPIYAGNQILNGLANAWVNQVDVQKTVTLGVTEFHAGEAFNIIPDDAYISGSIRYFDKKAGEDAYEVLRNTAIATGKVHHTEVDFDEMPQSFLDPIVNDLELAELAAEGIEEVFPDAVVRDQQWFASETFAYYQKLAPTVFTLVGIKNDDLGSGAGHHNAQFDFDDEALKYGITAMTNFAVKFLQE